MLDLCSKQEEILKIIRGENKLITVTLVDVTNQPIDLTGVTEVDAVFLKEDGSCLHKKLSLAEITLISEPGGKFSIILLPADTQLLKLSSDEYSDIEIRYTIAGVITYVQLKGVIQVIGSLFAVGC